MSEGRTHFVGVGGCGMSALAQFHVLGGKAASGSDRLLDRGGIAVLRRQFEALGIRLFPQDASGVDRSVSELVVSTAIEDTIADLARARELGIPVLHRTDVLARHVREHKTLAVAGTSGKSTVTAMVFEILETAGQGPSIITGAPLNSLKKKGFIGSGFQGKSDLLVIEADESDGTLPKYAPWLGLLLNVSKDHKELADLHRIFQDFRARSGRFVVLADAAGLEAYQEGAVTYGFERGQVRGRDLETSGRGSRFTVEGVRFELPLPGRYNAENALAAAAACREAGVPLATAAEALSRYQGIERRFELVGRAGDVEVIDDYAHNPEKVRAVLEGAHARIAGRPRSRVLALYQLHGFTPTRFLKNEFITAFSRALHPEDVLWLPPIYYVGGTAVKDIAAAHIAQPVRASGKDARAPESREAAAEELAREARPGDIVLVLGARDPTLSDCARGIFERLQARWPAA